MENTQLKKVERPTVLQSVELQKYILETSVYPREPLPLKELREATTKHHMAFYSTTPDAGQLMAMLLKLLDAKKTIEIGVYTGYSLLLAALTIPDDGKITAIDINRDTYEICLPVIRNAGVEHKIDFINSLALPALDKLLEDESNEGSFDFGFVDADKDNYLSYHERMMKLLKIGGMVIYDNTLWGGTVAGPIKDAPVGRKKWHKEVIEFNKFIAVDHRVELCIAPVGDGMTICRRLH